MPGKRRLRLKKINRIIIGVIRIILMNGFRFNLRRLKKRSRLLYKKKSNKIYKINKNYKITNNEDQLIYNVFIKFKIHILTL